MAIEANQIKKKKKTPEKPPQQPLLKMPFRATE